MNPTPEMRKLAEARARGNRRAFALVLILLLVFWVPVGYVAVHFLRKVW